MSVTWSDLATALIGATIATLAVFRFGRRVRQRNVHFEFHWHSRQRDEAKEESNEPDPDGGR